jgi:streptogramin lyase/plastocyanin
MRKQKCSMFAASIFLYGVISGAMAETPQKPFTFGYTFREFALDHPAAGPAIVAVDEDDTVWVALAKSGKLARFMNGNVRLFDLGADSRPVGIAVGTKSNNQAGFLWIAASYDNKIVRFEKATGKTREYAIDGENSWPFNIAIAPNGAIWFTERASSRIGLLEPETGKVKHFDVPTPNAGPAGLAIDPKSAVVWFTESYADRIGSLDPATGAVSELKMSDTSTGLVSGPAGLAIDHDGGIWFAKLEGKLGYIAPPYREIMIKDAPEQARRPAGITVSSTGEIWAVALDGNLLLRYQPANSTFQMFPLPTGEPDAKPGVPPAARTSRPFGIAADSSGNIWFSEQYTGQLGVLNIAPPFLEVLSPRGTVRVADPLFTARSTDRIYGIRDLSLEVDSAPVSLQHGRLNLRGIAPGQHVLAVKATGFSGQSTQASISFEYAPGIAVLTSMLRDLQPSKPEAEKAKSEMVAVAESLSKGEIAGGVSRIREALSANAGNFSPFNQRVLLAVLDFQVKHAGRSVGVSILDAPPYFSPNRITVRKGDVVAWKYDPPSDGHSISHELHGIEIASAHARSETLRAGESFSYKFEATGEFEIVDSRHPEARAFVLVKE